MVDNTDGRQESNSRRKFLIAGGAAALTGLAGCSGGSNSGGDGSDGSDGSGGTGSSTSGSDGSSGESGDPMLAENSEFDPAEPTWEGNNYLSSALVDAGYQRGSTTDLENMRNREVEEVPHGQPVQETPSDESELLDPDTLVFTESPSEDVQGRFEGLC